MSEEEAAPEEPELRNTLYRRLTRGQRRLTRGRMLVYRIAVLVAWGLLFATVSPVRQAYLNELIPSEQRATGLSFDSLMGSGGGVIAQPLLGKAADVWGYPASYICGAAIQLMAAPFIWLVRRQRPDL